MIIKIIVLMLLCAVIAFGSALKNVLYLFLL